jgi:TRAP-type mannitol/chloroaromatic compound transport system substrate-binding protein
MGWALAGAAMLVTSAASAQEYRWRVATIDTESGFYTSSIMIPFTELVEQLTGGRMVVEIAPAGTVGNIFRLHEAVQDGLVELVNAPPSFLGTADPVNAMIAGFPTGLGTDSFHAWIYQGGGAELWVQHRHETMDMHPLVCGSGPSEWFAHSHVELTSIEDLQGVRYRTLGNWAAVIADQFGASPVTIPGSEIYGLLERRGIDMAEYSMPAENWNQGYHEVTPITLYPGIHAPAWAFELAMTLDNWNSLPRDIQVAMEAACRIVTHDAFLRSITADLEAVAKLRESGNRMVELSPEFQARAREGARAWAMKVSAEAEANGNPWPKRVAESIFAFQDQWIENSFYMVVDHE